MPTLKFTLAILPVEKEMHLGNRNVRSVWFSAERLIEIAHVKKIGRGANPSRLKISWD